MLNASIREDVPLGSVISSVPSVFAAGTQHLFQANLKSWSLGWPLWLPGFRTTHICPGSGWLWRTFISENSFTLPRSSRRQWRRSLGALWTGGWTLSRKEHQASRRKKRLLSCVFTMQSLCVSSLAWSYIANSFMHKNFILDASENGAKPNSQEMLQDKKIRYSGSRLYKVIASGRSHVSSFPS